MRLAVHYVHHVGVVFIYRLQDEGANQERAQTKGKRGHQGGNQFRKLMCDAVWHVLTGRTDVRLQVIFVEWNCRGRLLATGDFLLARPSMLNHLDIQFAYSHSR